MIMQISKCGNLSGINQKPIIAIEGRHIFYLTDADPSAQALKVSIKAVMLSHIKENET